MRKSTMKKFLAAWFTLMVVLTVLAGHTMLTSMAKEEHTPVPYYKSIQIQEGDNLWKIAGRYREGSSMTTEEYVKELKKMNGLKKDVIHAGQYLTVVYYEK